MHDMRCFQRLQGGGAKREVTKCCQGLSLS
jgi:hypothetical protein